MLWIRLRKHATDMKQMYSRTRKINVGACSYGYRTKPLRSESRRKGPYLPCKQRKGVLPPTNLMMHINTGERLYCILFKYFLSTYDIQTASHAVYIVAKIASVDAVHTLV